MEFMIILDFNNSKIIKHVSQRCALTATHFCKETQK